MVSGMSLLPWGARFDPFLQELVPGKTDRPGRHPSARRVGSGFLGGIKAERRIEFELPARAADAAHPRSHHVSIA
jgi:hypothetical protein